MLHAEALTLNDGDEVWYIVQGKKDSVVKYLAGPFQEGKVWKIAGNLNGVLGYFDIQHLEAKPRIPVPGETWLKKSDGRSRYVDAVTDKWVILKGHKASHDSRAVLMTVEFFRETYRPNDW